MKKYRLAGIMKRLRWAYSKVALRRIRIAEAGVRFSLGPQVLRKEYFSEHGGRAVRHYAPCFRRLLGKVRGFHFPRDARK